MGGLAVVNDSETTHLIGQEHIPEIQPRPVC